MGNHRRRRRGKRADSFTNRSSCTPVNCQRRYRKERTPRVKHVAALLLGLYAAATRHAIRVEIDETFMALLTERLLAATSYGFVKGKVDPATILP